jgi:NAD-dependent deacetylase
MPAEAMRLAMAACADCDVFLAIGSSLVVHPAASLPVLAAQNGAALIIINRTVTPLDGIADLVVSEEIGKALPALVQC